jgi:hypothetical protein
MEFLVITISFFFSSGIGSNRMVRVPMPSGLGGFGGGLGGCGLGGFGGGLGGLGGGFGGGPQVLCGVPIGFGVTTTVGGSEIGGPGYGGGIFNRGYTTEPLVL